MLTDPHLNNRHSSGPPPWIRAIHTPCVFLKRAALFTTGPPFHCVIPGFWQQAVHGEVCNNWGSESVLCVHSIQPRVLEQITTRTKQRAHLGAFSFIPDTHPAADIVTWVSYCINSGSRSASLCLPLLKNAAQDTRKATAGKAVRGMCSWAGLRVPVSCKAEPLKTMCSPTQPAWVVGKEPTRFLRCST